MVDVEEQTERIQTFYGLKHDPFGALVDSMVFSSAGRRYEIAETLRHLLTYSAQDTILLGAVGIGKRTLTSQVIKSLDPQWRVAWVDGSSLASLTDFYQEVIGQLGLGIKVGEDTAVSSDITRAIKARSEEESFLLIVQNLTEGPTLFVDSLLELREMADSVENRLRQIWLVDSEEALTEQVNELDWYRQRILPLEEDSAYQYLKDRFVAAGCVKDFPIDTKDVSRLNDLANGIPQELNLVARDYLISSTFKTADKGFSFPITHVAAGAVALTLVVIAILYQASETYNKPAPAKVEDTSEAMSTVEKKLAEAVAQVEAKQNASPPQVDDIKPIDNSLDVSTPQQVVTQQVVTQQDHKEPNVVAGSDNKSNKSELKPDTSEKSVAGRSLIKTSHSNEYTLQLIGVRDRSKLDPLLGKFALDAPVEVIETTYKEAAWYVLIYGHYPDKESAINDISALPESLNITNPWARTFGSIQQ